MTEPDLTAAQQEAVRRLLAQARHDEPMPDDVAARLDDVVAGLTAAREGAGDVVAFRDTGAAATAARDRSSTDPAADTDAAPHRPRRWPAYLLSAAAVVAIGFGLTQVLPGDDSSDGGADSTAARSLEENSNQDKADEQPSMGAVPPPTAASEPPLSKDSADPSLSAPPLPDIPGLSAVDEQSGKGDSSAELDQRRSARLAERCLPDDVPSASALREATYRGKRAVVVYLPPTGSVRPVQVYVCGSSSDEPVADATVPLGE